MRLAFARARIEAWLRPTLTVPFAPALAPALAPLSARSVEDLLGLSPGDTVTLESPSGVPIPVVYGAGWTVADVAHALAEIDRLPVIDPGSRRA